MNVLQVFSAFLTLILVASTPGLAQSEEAPYRGANTLAVGFLERAQEEEGYASGFSVTDIAISDQMTPNFDLGMRLRFIGGYGPASVFNFATYDGINNVGPQAPTGFDRPIITARQLIYGSFSHGRWYILELGLPIFNISGFIGEYYHYWSQRIALHEALPAKLFNTHFELGATVRSITQFLQPTNTALIYPPTIDGMAGIEKDIGEVHIATDFKFEQALTDTTTAGSFDNSTTKPYGISTRLQFGLETGYHFKNDMSVILRGSQRVFRYPDTDNSALWATFDEATLGRSLTLAWKGEW